MAKVRTYTPEQMAARRAASAAWRARNRDRVEAYNQRPDVRKRRAKWARARRREDPMPSRKATMAYAERDRERRIAQGRAYRERKLAANPNYFRDKCRIYRATRPSYEKARRARQLRKRWLRWARTCAASRARRAGMGLA